MIRVRFAPAPTGSLFVSGTRVALANYLFALRGNGQLLLRLDDLEQERSRPAAAAGIWVDQIMQDLRWIGIGWQACFRQSERLERYQATIERLKRDRFIYPCFESQEELRVKQDLRRKRNQSPIYDRTMLSLTEKQRRDAEAGGKRPHWRFKLSGRRLEWKDLVLGPRHAMLSAVSDPILVRADGSPTPILTSVVDDVDYATSHIIRSEDSPGNTAVQIELFEVLRGSQKAVRVGHLPPLADTATAASSGRRASNLALRNLRNDGVEPLALAACLTGIGVDNSELRSLDGLAPHFDLIRFAASRFEVTGLLAANRIVLRTLDFAAVADRLPDGATEAFWTAVRGNLDLLQEARGWWDVVAGSIVPPVVETAHDLLQTAASLLPPEPWDNDVWTRWIIALEQVTGHSGEALMMPLRLALTGEEGGPDLAALLPLIGRARAVSRLAIAAA